MNAIDTRRASDALRRMSERRQEWDAGSRETLALMLHGQLCAMESQLSGRGAYGGYEHAPYADPTVVEAIKRAMAEVTAALETVEAGLAPARRISR